MAGMILFVNESSTSLNLSACLINSMSRVFTSNASSKPNKFGRTRKTMDQIKEELRDTGLISVYGLNRKELDEAQQNVRLYTESLKNKGLPDFYKNIRFGTKLVTLTDAQHSIVVADLASHYKIIACAGSGKSTTIICRIKYLIDSGIEPNEIILTTFNVDAAKSMRDKLDEVFGFKINIICGTIDSIAFRFYNMYFKRRDFVGISEYCTEFLNFLQSGSDAATNLLSRIRYVFFDEFQDSNSTQYEITKIFAKQSWVTVIGDDAQNIYQWRGSDMSYIMNFESHLPTREMMIDDESTEHDRADIATSADIKDIATSVDISNIDDISDDPDTDDGTADADASDLIESSDIPNTNIRTVKPRCQIMTLSHNFRSTPEILEFANRSIEKNTDQIPKQMIGTHRSYGRLPRVSVYKSADEEAMYTVEYIKQYVFEGKIRPEEIVVLARNNYSIKKVEELLEINNQSEKKINYVALITDDTRDTKPAVQSNHITLTTIHKSKGLEWDVVFVLGCNDDKFPSETTPIKLQEDRRLFYVAVTRAKRYLNFSFVSNKSVTRFIGELDRDLYDFADAEDKYFIYKDERNIKFKNGVTQLIEMLEPQDIELMRRSNLFPALSPVVQTVHKSHTYSDFIDKYYLQADYGIYIDRYIARQLGIVVPGSGGLNDSTANRVLNSLHLSKEYYTLFMKYNFNIQRKIDYAYHQNCTTYEILKRLNIQPTDPPYIRTIEPADETSLAFVIKSITDLSRKIGCDPSQIYVTTVSHLPHAFYDEYFRAYERFKSSASGDIVLKDIYRISLCQNVYDGRRRLLYKDCFSEFDTDRSLYADINTWCRQYSGEDIKTKETYVDDELSICGELDAIILTQDAERIIDFKCSATSECKLEWIIQLLMYASLHKKNTGLTINALSIYNPLRGTMTDINVGSWDKHAELLKFMDSIRTDRLGRK